MFSFGSSDIAITGDVFKHSGFIVDVSKGNVMLGRMADVLGVLIEDVNIEHLGFGTRILN